MTPAPPPTETAWRALLVLAAVRLGLFLYSTLLFPYGYVPDEFYFLDCADRMAWGYVDHPPFSIAVLWLVRGVFGDSLIGLRLIPALANASAVVLTGLIARELGGGRTAQVIAALMYLIAPAALAMSSFYSMNALEQPLWALAAFVLLRLIHGGNPRLWLGLGVLLGIGLLNKPSVLWLGAGLAVGIVMTPHRQWLSSGWIWAAGAIALAIFAPNVIWQAQHDWPTLEFMQTGMSQVLVRRSTLQLLASQVIGQSVFTAPLWMAGVLYLLIAPAARPYRLLGWLWLTVFAILSASGTARPYYLTPANCIVVAAGAVVFESWTQRSGWKPLPWAVAIVLLISGGIIAPLAIPLLPPGHLVAYERALHVPRARTEFEEGALPIQFALRFGWPELTQAVASVYGSLSLEERASAGVLAFGFDTAGAISFYGRAAALPPVIATHNNYWLWGPGRYSGEVMIVVSSEPERLAELFESVEARATVACEYCLPALARQTVYLCRRSRQSLQRAWPTLKNFS